MVPRLNLKTNRFINPTIIIWLMMLAVLAISVYENFITQDGNSWKEVIASDGRGYYAYLPSVFVYSEVGFDSVVMREKEVYPSVQAANFIVEVDGKLVNKYFIGVALLMSPFFLMGTVISLVVGLPPNGFNSIYQLMSSLSALFYLFLGLAFLQKLLKLFCFKQWIINIVLLLVLFATNLLIYTVAAPAMSHVYSFAAIAGFMFSSARYLAKQGRGDALLAVLFLALIVLIRPINAVVVLLLPMLAHDFRSFVYSLKTFFSSGWSYLILMAGIIVLLIQPLWWYFQTGELFLWSYSGEGFYFANPQIVKVLFSFRKGLFVYTPVCFVAIIGLVPLWRSDWRKGAFAAFFLLVYVWVVSSWWNWYYGDSFGQRVFIDIYPVFAILLAYLINWVSRIRWLGIATITLSLLLLVFNLFQSWQYSRGIIHPFAMDSEKYKTVFLRTGQEFRYIFNGLEDIPPYKTNMKTPIRSWVNNFEQIDEAWVTSGRIESPNAHNGRFVSQLNNGQQYSSALLINDDALLMGKKGIYARINAWVFETEPGTSKKMNLVVSLADSADVGYYFKSMAVDEMPVSDAGYWRKVSLGFVLPELLDSGNRLKIFFWYQGQADILVDDFSVELYGRRNP
jgi:hypothetical protein